MSENTTARRRFREPGYTERMFLDDVIALANGEELPPERLGLVADKAAYNVEGLVQRTERAAARKGAKAPGSSKNPADSEYGRLVQEYAREIMEETGNQPMSCGELADAMAARNYVNTNSGKPIQPMWIARVLNQSEDWQVAEDIRHTTGKDGLGKDSRVKVYNLKG